MLVVVSLFACFADVMYDAAMVEISKSEECADSGKYQSWCWVARSAGELIAALAAGYGLRQRLTEEIIRCASMFPWNHSAGGMHTIQ